MKSRGTFVTRRACAAVACAFQLLAGVLRGESLEQRIPRLFGAVLSTSINPQDMRDAQRPLVAERFRGLSAALAAARSQVPAPSASGAFRFAWDPELDSFVRYNQSLGPSIAERAHTIGRSTATFSLTYTRIDFDSLEGDSLRRIRSAQPALSDEFLAQLPPGDQLAFRDDVLETRLDLSFGFDLFFLTAAYGISDSIDLSLALSLAHARMRGRAQATILDPNGNGAAFFTFDQKGVITSGSGPICELPYRCARDGFHDSAFGTGDVFLRGKWHFVEATFVDLAIAGVLTLPTGNARDFLGFHDLTFTPWLIASRAFGSFSPHLNAGYALRSGEDVSQAQWIAGADWMATPWLTLGADLLGYHDDRRDGINDDILQFALGLKVNVWRAAVLATTVQFPLNEQGLRSDGIYTLQVESTFW